MVTYTPTDVQRRYRELLDTARRDGEAQVRDTDGLILSVIPAERVEFGRDIARHLADAARFQAVYAARDQDPPADWARLTPYPHLAVLDSTEIHAFARELLGTLLDAGVRGSLQTHEGNLAAWHSTAAIISDAGELAKLTAPLAQAEIVPLARVE